MRLSSKVDEVALTRELIEVASIPNEEISRRERERLFVRKAVARLPQLARILIFLKFWEGETLEQIAQTLNWSVEQTRSEYVVALMYLEKVLKPHLLESDFFLRECMRKV